SAGLPDTGAGHTEERDVQGGGRCYGVCTGVREGGRTRTQAGRHLHPRRAAASDARGVALLRLLRQLVCRPTVLREPRLRRALRELPARHRLRLRLPPSTERRG